MKEVILNTKWEGKNIVCAKSVSLCKSCKDKYNCEKIKFVYDEYADIEEAMDNRYGIDEVKCKGR